MSALSYSYASRAAADSLMDYVALNGLPSSSRRAMPALIAGGAIALGLLARRFVWRYHRLPRIRREERHDFHAVS